MIKLVFMRHGEAEASHGEDRARALTSFGKRQAQEVAKSLAKSGFAPHKIVSSNARRAPIVNWAVTRTRYAIIV